MAKKKRVQKGIKIGQPQLVPISSLYLDKANPRLSGSEDGASQNEIIKTLWREMAVDEIAYSIVANGYFAHEVLLGEKGQGGKYVVIEGNRRLAAVKLLLDPKLQKYVGAGATELPSLNARQKDDISQLPLIECKRSEIWQYVGFKHVNGPQPWESSSKAHYIAWVHNTLGVPLEQIALQIGDRHSTVKRLYRGLMVLKQAEQEKVFDCEDRSKKRFAFSHLYTALDQSGFEKFLGISKGTDFKHAPVPKRKVKQLGEVCRWLYGSKSQGVEPIIQSQNPDLRQLDEVLQSKNAVAALRSGLTLKRSLEISRGDERLLREALVVAKQALQEARGKLVTGFDGQDELVETACDIKMLADSIVDEMEGRISKSKSKKR